MGKNSISMNFDGFDGLLDQLDKLAGDEGLKRAVSIGMKQAKEITDEGIKKAMRKSNLPAKGKYSTGKSLSGVKAQTDIKWNGDVAELEVGFNRKISLTPVFLMYGSPRYAPVKGLKKALKFGQKQKNSVNEAVQKVVQRMINGGS